MTPLLIQSGRTACPLGEGVMWVQIPHSSWEFRYVDETSKAEKLNVANYLLYILLYYGGTHV